MKLIENKVTDYRIVIPANPTESQRYAADELAKYLELISGAKLPVVCDCSEPQEKEIVIGRTNREGAPCGCGLKNDGYTYKTVGEKLFILGENDRGNLYGVYQLLENELGCRFLSERVEKIPARSTVELPELDKTVIPPLEYRQTFWYEPQHFDTFAIKRGFNANCFGTPYSEKVGGSIRVDALAHTIFNYVGPDEYFDEHPEYFSMVDGVRIKDHTQVCLTNPEVLEITKRKLRQNIIDHPEIQIFGISQMDWYNPCTCPECARVDAEEGNHMGTMLRFLNALAEDIEEDYPDIIIETLAYQYTRQAPKITRPHKNICICLCTIECCFAHPLRECNEIMHPFKARVIGDAHYQDDMRDWGKICKRMFIWDYTTNYRFYLASFPNFHVLKDNINFFLENGVTGLFEQGNAQSVSGEFGELRAYVISKLMWNPDLDVEQAMDEFMTGYYGVAAAPIRKYIRLLTDHLVKDHVHMGIYDDPTWYITDEALEQGQLLWDEAESLASDEEELTRIRKSRLQLRYCQIQRMPLEDPARAGLIDQLEKDVVAHGLTYIRESRSLEFSFEALRAGGPYR